MTEGLLYTQWIGECLAPKKDCGHRMHYGETQAIAGQRLFEHLMGVHDMTPKQARSAIRLSPGVKQVKE